MLQQIQKEIENLRLQKADKEKTIQEMYADLPTIKPPLKQFDERCPKVCKNWNGGNYSCRHHCGVNEYKEHREHNESREHQHKQRIEPVHRSLQIIDAKIIDLELKSTLPYLRNELLSSISDYDQLEKTDPQYRQKQSDMKKSIYKQSQKVDELETKFNWFGNIPTNEPKIITPEPILQTTVHYEVNKRPLLILGALGLIGLFVIWRFKQ